MRQYCEATPRQHKCAVFDCFDYGLHDHDYGLPRLLSVNVRVHEKIARQCFFEVKFYALKFVGLGVVVQIVGVFVVVVIVVVVVFIVLVGGWIVCFGLIWFFF